MAKWLKPGSIAYAVVVAPFCHGQGRFWYVTRGRIEEVEGNKVLLLTDCCRRMWLDKKEVKPRHGRCKKTVTVQKYKVKPLSEYLEAVPYFKKVMNK